MLAKLDYIRRLLATGFCFVLFGVGGLILGFLVFPIVHLFAGSRERGVRACRFAVRLCFRAFAYTLSALGPIGHEIHRRELLERKGQLIVANHPSLIDVVLLMAYTPNASCIVRAGLFQNIFTRGPVRWSGFVCNDTGERLIDDCVAQIKSGANLIIFPEGTRTVRGKPLKFHRGAAHVWLKARCPLTLVTIKCEPPTLARGEPWYQIPPKRAHFWLNPCDNTRLEYDSARAVTQYWQDYFSSENQDEPTRAAD
ncbi:MAG: 1-acyl-sn-glycerol-3-phosphate acyltransferase [Gammaproteobacteria bacterium]|nr:MAG: 1-acyl-sn-glycerol-3-phosphate acyltransferase [Gammaproteobacteria bacterium]